MQKAQYRLFPEACKVSVDLATPDEQFRAGGDPQSGLVVRCFSFYCAYYSFHYSCGHVLGVMNVTADARSRNNLPLFLFLSTQGPQFSIPPALERFLSRCISSGVPAVLLLRMATTVMLSEWKQMR